MPKIVKNSISANEMLEILKKQYLNTKDIKLLACVGMAKALAIKKAITTDLENDKLFYPPGFVPSKKVMEYLNLNLKYLKKFVK